MAYQIKREIVVPAGFVAKQMGLRLPFGQVHLHSTGNPNDTVDGEVNYLKGHYASANYTHLVGITNGQVDIRQVADTNGGAYDVGGDWNWEAYAAIEFAEGTIKSQADFQKAYPAYIWLARYLAGQDGLKDLTLDTANISGVKTHNYCSRTGHGSDHVDPLPFLAKWGISYDQLKKDIKNGLAVEPTVPAAKYKVGDTVMVKATATKSFTGYNIIPWRGDKHQIVKVYRQDISNSHWAYDLDGNALNVLEQDLVPYQAQAFQKGDWVQLLPTATKETNGYSLVSRHNWMGQVASVTYIDPYSKSNYEYEVKWQNGTHNVHIAQQDLKLSAVPSKPADTAPIISDNQKYASQAIDGLKTVIDALNKIK